MTRAEALLDTLRPGDADFPPGRGIAESLRAHARFGPPLATVLRALPEDMAQLPQADRITAVQQAEVAHPAAFDAMIVGVYSLYYTDPVVAQIIGRLTGHSAAPPQPQGHALAPFDPALVAVPAGRGPLYRPTPEVPT